MKIANILNDSVAEVEGHLADVIWFQGCIFKCPYCFNPELQPLEGGKEMDWKEVYNSLSSLSDVVVFTGGEPLLQYQNGVGILSHIIQAKGKKVIIETSLFNADLYHSADKIYASLFCYRPIEGDHIINTIEKSCPKVEFVIVIGYPEFRLDVLRQYLKLIRNRTVWIKFYNGKTCKIDDIYRIFKSYRKPFKVLEKLQI